MLNLARKIALITGAVCLLAMVTGVTLALHLAGEEHPEKHDCEHCPICRQIFINPAKAIMPVGQAVILESIILCQVDFIFDTPVVIEETLSCIPRAPPLIHPRSVSGHLA